MKPWCPGDVTFLLKIRWHDPELPSLGINDWYLLSIIPRDLINAKTLNIINATVFYGLSVLIILGVVAAWAFYSWNKNHRSIEQARMKIQSIYRTVPSAIVSFVIDEECRVMNANAAFYHLLGCTEEEFVKRYDAKLINVLEKDERVKLNDLEEGMGSQEFCLRDATGKEKWIFANFDVQVIEGKQAKLSVACRYEPTEGKAHQS